MLRDVSWATSGRARRVMQGNRSRDTLPELRLRSELHRRGLRYRVAVRPIRSVRRSADIVFTKHRLAVFVDGCFWHGCPDHYKAPKQNLDYWTKKIEGNQVRDGDTSRRLAEAGWTVLRIWEHEVTAVAADRVEATLRDLQVPVGLDLRLL